MSRLLLTEDLIEELLRRTAAPNTQSDGSADADLLDYLNDELLYTVVPEIMDAREEYFVVTEQLALSASTSRYRIPDRAIGTKLRTTFWVDAATPSQRSELVCIGRDDAVAYGANTRNRPGAYYIEGNHIVIVPELSATPSGIVEAAYYFRPGKLVKAARYCKVTAVTATTVTVDALPSDNNLAVGEKVDIHSGRAGAEVKSWNNEITDITTTVITLTDAVDGSVAGTTAVEVGDYVCLENEAAAPMGVPLEVAPIIVQAATCRYVENKGAPEEYKAHQETLKRQMNALSRMLDMRVEGQPKKITNRRGIWRGNRRRWGR